MEFRVLGALEALEDGYPISLGGPKQRAVLAMLLLEANHSVSTDRLVDGLWGDDPPRRAAATLQVYVSNLRKALEPDRTARAVPSTLLTQPPGYLLLVDRDDLDLFRFEDLLGVARLLWAEGCVPGATILFREALALWRAEPLADLAHEPFARLDVPRLEEARMGAIEDCLEAELALGRDIELLPELEALVARNPYREHLRGQLMIALYRAGRQADALAAFQVARRALVDELGLEPGPELREIEAAILVQDPALAAVEPSPLDAMTVERVLRAVNGADPDPELVRSVVEEGWHSARRADEALRCAIDRERSTRLTATLAVAGTAHAELMRARHVIVDGVLDRRRREPRRAPVSRAARNGDRGRTVRTPCPYKGLLRFEPEDAAWYFGRERLVAELLAAVASARCTGIVGASGSGKSSLARAGLLGALGDDALPGSAQWPRVLLTPGADPVLELAHALAPVCHASSPGHVRDRLLEEPESLSGLAAHAANGSADGTSVLVVVDQLEEVFTSCHDASLRERFLDVLVHGACDPDSPVRILVAIRADYYGRCAEHPAFAELLAQTNVLVGAMRPDELQRAIEEPARAAGLVLEDGLVERIFDDVGSEPGSLPLLETALLETWTRRDGNLLTLDGYEASGGVRGAVAHLAEGVYARMSAPEQDIARGIFLRLAEPGSGSDDVRRRAPLEELVVDDDHGAVLAALVEQRLVVTGDSAAEVAHEALLREWPRLRTWLDEDRDGRRLHHRLATSAADWEAAGRDPAELYRGARLASALDWSTAHPGEPNRLERDFLDAAGAQHDAELRTVRRTARRLRALLAATAVLLVVAIAAGTLSLVQRGEARDRARAEELTRLTTQVATLPLDQLDRALLLGVEARRIDHSAATAGALEAALALAPPGLEHLIAVPGGVGYARASPNGRRMVTSFRGGRARIVALPSGRVLRTLKLDPSVVVGIPEFSPDGRLVVFSSAFGAVGTFRVFSVRTGRPVGPLVQAGSGVVLARFLPTDPTRLVTASASEIIRWDLSDPKHPRPIGAPLLLPEDANPEQTLMLFVLDPDGRTIATSATGIFALIAEGTTSVWDLESGARLLGPLPGRPGAFTPDGSQLVLGGADQIRFVDVATGAERRSVDVGFDAGTSLLMRSDGQRLAVADADGAVRVLDLLTGQPIGESLSLFTGSTGPIAFLPGDRLLVGGQDKAAVWRYRAGAPAFAALLPGHTGAVDARFVADGKEVVTTGADDHQALRFRTRDGRPLGPAPDPAAALISGGEASPDGETLAVPHPDGTVILRDRRTGSPLSVLPTSQTGPIQATWSPTGSVLATASGADRAIVLWDVSDLHHPAELHRIIKGKTLDYNFRGAAFSPDGRVVAVNDYPGSGRVTFLHVASGRVLRRVSLGGQIGGLVYSPDGETIATIRYVEGTLLLLDAATGRIRATRDVAGWPQGSGFVHGGRRIATHSLPHVGSLDGPIAIELWDATTLDPLGEAVTVDADGGPLGDPSPDGMQLVIGTQAGYAVLFDLNPRHWERLACRIAGRNLTRAEWDQYLPGREYHVTCAR